MLQKLERYIFYIFLFSIPFQARKILYFEGWRFNEWQSVSLYLTDLLLLVLFLFWFFSTVRSGQISNLKFLISKQFQNPKSQFQKPDFYLILFLIISAVSIKNSDNQIISWFQWLKLVEFAAFYWYLSHYAFKKFGIFNSFFTLFFSGLFQAVLSITQFLKQSNIGLKYLGESVINIDLPGIASFYMTNGEKIIRSYGTLPHPNVLAAYIFMSLFSFYFIYFYSRIHSEHEPFADPWDKFTAISYGIMVFALFTTFSRVVVFTWFISFCLRAIIIPLRRHYRSIFGTGEARKRIKALLIISFISIVLFSSLYFSEISSRLNISGGDQAVELRVFYAQEALRSGSVINFFGIGLGNFVSWLISENPYMPFYAYQPVHNIYLLMYSETGILGLLAFILLLVFLIKDFVQKTRLNKSYHLSLAVFLGGLLFISFFDHFFWTLQQGRIILWLVLGVLTFYSKGDIIEKQG